MAIKAADQISIVDVTDAYSVILSNESHTFVGSTSAALAGTATTNVYAFLGGEPVAVTIGTITGKTGISGDVSNNGSTNVLITFTVTTALTAGGTIDIPVTITGTDVVITKKFTYGIAFQGTKGSDGRGIQSTAITYQVGSSGETAPTGTWGTNVPSVAEGQYLWTRTIITYTDKSTSTSYSVGKMGVSGTDGKGIKSTAVTYQKGTSGTTTPTGTWVSSVPTVSATEYLWTRTVITYTDDTKSTSYSVGMMGAPGADAITISITTDNGNIFKNSSGTTTLTAHVYQGGKELSATEIEKLGTLKWYKDDSTTAAETGATLSVSAASITNKAVYTVQLEG